MATDPEYARRMREHWSEQSRKRWARLTQAQQEAHRARKRAQWAKDKAAGKQLYRRRIPRTLVVQLILSQSGLCAICKGPLGEFQSDHIVPRSAGGTDDPANIQLLCEPCNRRKANK